MPRGSENNSPTDKKRTRDILNKPQQTRYHTISFI